MNMSPLSSWPNGISSLVPSICLLSAARADGGIFPLQTPREDFGCHGGEKNKTKQNVCVSADAPLSDGGRVFAALSASEREKRGRRSLQRVESHSARQTSAESGGHLRVGVFLGSGAK